MVKLAPRARRQPRRPAPPRAARLRALAAVRSPTSRCGARRSARDGPAGTSSASAMSMAEHGPTLDLHGGGTDLDLPAPRVRDRAERVGHGRAVRAALDALGDGQLRGREDEQVARQPRVRQRPAESRRPARDPPGAVAPPLPRRLRVVRHRYRRRHRAAPSVACGRASSTPAPTRGRSPSGSATRSTTISTRRARSRRSTIWPARCSRPHVVGDSGRSERAPVLRELGSLVGVDLTAPFDAHSVESSAYGEQITVTLPDSSTRGSRRERRPPRSRRRSGPARQGRARGQGRRRLVDLNRPLDHDVALSRRHAGQRRRARGVAPLHRARPRASRRQPLSRAPSTRSVPRSPTASITTSSCRRQQTFTEDDLARIDAEMRSIVAADQRFVREELDYDAGLAVFAEQPFKREIIEKVREGEADAEDAGEAAALRRRRRERVPQPRVRRHVDFIDLCRGPHVPSTDRLGAFKLMRSRAPTGAATRKVRSSSASTAPRGRARRRSPSTCTASRRPSAATIASSAPSSTCSASPTRSVRASPSSIPRAASSAGSWRTTRASATKRPDYEFVYSPHITKEELVRDVRAPRLVRRRHVPAHGARRGGRHDYYLKPMNCPFHILDLQALARAATASCPCACSSSAPCTATRSRASCTGSRACVA